jgi:HSP20 family protein
MMTLVRWYPRTDAVDLGTEVNRLLEDVFGPPDPSATRMSPRVDVCEDKDEYLVAVEAPGMAKEDVKISVHENTLTIKGERRKEEPKEGTKYHRAERSWGPFQRSFRLPRDVQADKVSAVYKDGVLKVTVPKAEKARPREIPVAVK